VIIIFLLAHIDYVYTLLGLVFSSMALGFSGQIHVGLNLAIIFVLIKVWSKEIPHAIDLLKKDMNFLKRKLAKHAFICITIHDFGIQCCM
jgi:hypothetical protein